MDLLIGLAKYKFKSDEKAIALMKKDRRQQSGISQGSFPVGRTADRRASGSLFYLLFAPFPGPDQKGRSAELYADRRCCVNGRHGGFQECAPSKHGPVVRPLDSQPGGTKSRWQ